MQCSGGTIKGAALTPSDSPYPGSTGSTTGTITQTAQATNGQAGSCSITASDGGPVTARITWNGGSANAPAPSAAIVVETSTATWGGTVGDSPNFVFTPDPTAGFGSGVTLVGTDYNQGYTFPDGFGYSDAKSWSATRYSVATSGSSITTTCSPNFVLKGTTGVNSDSYEYCTMQYTYAVFALPSATVTFPSATTVNGTQTALTGQQIQAQFNYSGPGTVSPVQWDIESQEGASVVGGYVPTQRSGKITPVSFYNNPNPNSISFYDGIQDNVTVNATATVTFPDGTTGTLKASSQIAVVQPVVTAPIPFHLAEYDTFAQHGNDTSSNLGAHETWSGVTITMPAGFSAGTGCFAQMLNSTARTDTRHTGASYTYKVQLSDGTWGVIPTPCLDTNFPYPFAVQWQVSGTGSGEDFPNFQVAPPLVAGDAGRNDWYHASGEDHFTTWVMFTPNAQSSSDIWVPLGSFDWYWSSVADLDLRPIPPGWLDTTFMGDHGAVVANANWPTWSTYTPSGALAMHQ